MFPFREVYGFLAPFTIASAATGEEALEVLPNFQPDLILLDIMMPGMDGYEVCRRVRGTREFSATKIVLVSALASNQDLERGFEAGADDYVTKPFDPFALLELVRSHLGDTSHPRAKD